MVVCLPWALVTAHLVVNGQAWGQTGKMPLAGGSKGETVGLLLRVEGDQVATGMEDADIPNATLVLVIPTQLSFSNTRLLRLMGMSGVKKSCSQWRRPSLENI